MSNLQASCQTIITGRRPAERRPRRRPLPAPVGHPQELIEPVRPRGAWASVASAESWTALLIGLGAARHLGLPLAGTTPGAASRRLPHGSAEAVRMAAPAGKAS
jgi:hypothetical protein